jgi:hypothetical protein
MLRQRLQVFDQIPLLLGSEAKVKERVVVIDHVHQSREASIVVETTFVGRPHEQTFLAYEDAGQVHCLVNPIGRPIRLETVDADLLRLV